MGSRASGFFYKTVVLAAAAALAGSGPSLAAGQTVLVSGDSVPSECGAAKKADLSTELSGSLTGCWSAFVDHVNCQELNGFAFWTEIGHEEFEGKLDDAATKFDTQYTFNAIFPSGTLSETGLPRRKLSAGASTTSPVTSLSEPSGFMT